MLTYQLLRLVPVPFEQVISFGGKVAVERHPSDLIAKMEQVISIEKYEVIFRVLIAPHFLDQKMSRALLNQSIKQRQSASLGLGIFRSQRSLCRRMDCCFVVDHADDDLITFLLEFVSNG